MTPANQRKINHIPIAFAIASKTVNYFNHFWNCPFVWVSANDYGLFTSFFGFCMRYRLFYRIKFIHRS